MNSSATNGAARTQAGNCPSPNCAMPTSTARNSTKLHRRFEKRALSVGVISCDSFRLVGRSVFIGWIWLAFSE
jgi:hypothetical protein